MARKLIPPENPGTRTTPHLARFLLSRLAPRDFRDALLGDLQEQWQKRTIQTGQAPRAWYWQQVTRSIPTLIAFRLRAIGIWRFVLLLLAYAIGFLAITVWDIAISRALVGSLAMQDVPPSLLVLRAFYFGLFSFGAIVAALLATPIAFDKRWSLRANLLVGLAPVFLIVNGIVFAGAIAAEAFELLPYLMFRSALMGVMLVLTGMVVHKFRATIDRVR